MGAKGVKKTNIALRHILFFFVGLTAGTSLVVYLGSLYNQLTLAFFQEQQFIPTRIFSDISQIKPEQSQTSIERKLKSRAYVYQKKGSTIEFTLHPINYPTYLIPEEGNRFLDFANKSPHVILQFEIHNGIQILKSLTVDSQPLPQLYLEPELIALLNRSGVVKKEIRSSLKFSEIPAPVWKAIISIEDQHFLEHIGLDPRGIARAFWVNFKTLSLAQGGSTITQQLVKNLMARHSKNLFRKINELALAILLELRFDKEQILERYLNEVYLGQVGNLEIHGVAEGAQYFFGKSISDLNLGEIALMAGLIRGPGYYSPYRFYNRAISRKELVLKKMVETGQIAFEEAQIAAKLPIRLAPPQNTMTQAPYFSDYVKAEMIRLLKSRLTEQEITNSGLRVYTTLDTQMNQDAQVAISEGISSLEKRSKILAGARLEGALAAVDQKTGFLRALIGGRNYSQSTFNRILNMKRQVGSTFKPIVYLTAFQQKQDSASIPYGAGYPLLDAPWTLKFDQEKGSWSPSNYEKNFRGWIPLEKGLIHSVNVVSAKLGQAVGIDKVIQTAQSLGVQSFLPNVPSLSLGVAEMSPLELLKVYSTLANHGNQNDLTVIRSITLANGQEFARFTNFPKQVIDPGPVDLVADILTSVFKEGTAKGASRMGFHQQASGKTGTTSNHRDSWFAGFTPDTTAVVWIGLDQGGRKENVSENPPHSESPEKSRLVNLTGANAALPIWVSFMNHVLDGSTPNDFPPSPHLSQVKIDLHTGQLAQDSCPSTQVGEFKYMLTNAPSVRTCEPNWPTALPTALSP